MVRAGCAGDDAAFPRIRSTLTGRLLGPNGRRNSGSPTDSLRISNGMGGGTREFRQPRQPDIRQPAIAVTHFVVMSNRIRFPSGPFDAVASSGDDRH
jgi:hypothetical protein